MKLRPSIFGVLVLLLAWAPAVRAQDGFLGSLAHKAGARHLLTEFGQLFAAADFDNDQKPDAALLTRAGLLGGEQSFRIELHVTSRRDDALIFSSAERGLTIAALDVNRDGAPDIVIERPFTRQRVQVYLNDGYGGFHKARAEDYAFHDATLPAMRSWCSGPPPCSCLPRASVTQAAGLQTVSLMVPEQARSFSFWPEAMLRIAGARAPSQSRAPPASLLM